MRIKYCNWVNIKLNCPSVKRWEWLSGSRWWYWLGVVFDNMYNIWMWPWPLGEDHPKKVSLLKNWLVHLNIILLSYYNDLGSLCEDDADLFEHLHTSRISWCEPAPSHHLRERNISYWLLEVNGFIDVDVNFKEWQTWTNHQSQSVKVEDADVDVNSKDGLTWTGI